jgi:hypothetical protein
MTRPLDIYFKSTANQVWSKTKDEALEKTCQQFANAAFPNENNNTFSKYLETWLNEAPIFGRETSDLFIDHQFKNVDLIISKSLNREKMLSNLIDSENEHINYFIQNEKFIQQVVINQSLLDSAFHLYTLNNWEAVKSIVTNLSPERAIKLYAELIQNGETTRGEKGVLITLNSCWLPYFNGLKQALGEAPVKINFAPTYHDILGMLPASFAFHFEEDESFWQVIGPKQISNSKTVLNSEVENPVSQTGIQLLGSGHIYIKPFLNKSEKITPGFKEGQYKLELLASGDLKTIKEDIHLYIYKNSIKVRELENHLSLKNLSEKGYKQCSTYIDLNEGEYVELCFKEESSAVLNAISFSAVEE